MSTVTCKATIVEDVSTTCMARITDTSGSAITQASVSSIAYSVFDLTSGAPDTATSTGTPTVADALYDTLQTDTAWTAAGGDSTGYNFRYVLPASAVPDGGHLYLVEYWITPTTGDPFPIRYKLLAQNVRAS